VVVSARTRSFNRNNRYFVNFRSVAMSFAAFQDQIDRVDVRAFRLEDGVARIVANGAERG